MTEYVLVKSLGSLSIRRRWMLVQVTWYSVERRTWYKCISHISWFARSPQQQARQTMLCSSAFGTSHINKLQFNSSYASLSNFDRLLLNSSAFCALLGFAIRAPPTSGILAPAWLQSQVWIRTVLLHRSPP